MGKINFLIESVAPFQVSSSYLNEAITENKEALITLLGGPRAFPYSFPELLRALEDVTGCKFEKSETPFLYFVQEKKDVRFNIHGIII